MRDNPVLQSTWMLVAALCFTALAAVIKVATDTYSIYEIIFYRSVFGIFATFWMLRRLGISIKTSCPGLFFLRCAIGTLCICLGVYIVWVLPLGTAQTLTYTSPLFFALFSVIASIKNRRPISWFLIFSIIVGFFGIVLILRPTVDPALFMAMLLGIAVGITGAWADWMIRMLSERGEPPYRIVFYFVSAGTIVGAVATVMTGGFHPIDWREFILLLLIGVLGTLGQLTLTHAWKYGVPLINTLYQYSGVVFTVILGMFAFDDEFDWVTLLGIAIVCLSGVAVSLSTLRLAKNKLNSFKRLGRIEKSGKRWVCYRRWCGNRS